MAVKIVRTTCNILVIYGVFYVTSAECHGSVADWHLVTVKQVDVAVHSFVPLINAALDVHILSLSIYLPACFPSMHSGCLKWHMSTGWVHWIWFRYFHPYGYLKIRYRWKTCPGDNNGLVRCYEVSTHKHMCWIICKSCFNCGKYTNKRIGNWILNRGDSGKSSASFPWSGSDLAPVLECN
jgi:hypothetical protein